MAEGDRYIQDKYETATILEKAGLKGRAEELYEDIVRSCIKLPEYKDRHDFKRGIEAALKLGKKQEAQEFFKQILEHSTLGLSSEDIFILAKRTGLEEVADEKLPEVVAWYEKRGKFDILSLIALAHINRKAAKNYAIIDSLTRN